MAAKYNEKDVENLLYKLEPGGIANHLLQKYYNPSNFLILLFSLINS